MLCYIRNKRNGGTKPKDSREPFMVNPLIIAVPVAVVVIIAIFYLQAPRFVPHYTSRLKCPKCGKTFDYKWVPGGSLARAANSETGYNNSLFYQVIEQIILKLEPANSLRCDSHEV